MKIVQIRSLQHPLAGLFGVLILFTFCSAEEKPARAEEREQTAEILSLSGSALRIPDLLIPWLEEPSIPQLTTQNDNQTPRLELGLRSTNFGLSFKNLADPTQNRIQTLSKGAFTLPLDLTFPTDRGPIVYPISPAYSPTLSTSEWGSSISLNLSIQRLRHNGNLDFRTDNYMSPWGELERAVDGAYYPKDTTPLVRVLFPSEKTAVAYLANGTTLTFGKENVISTPSGIYAWFLVQAQSREMEFTRYQYERSTKNYLYLKEVLYGGAGLDFQYQIVLDYDSLSRPIIETRSGVQQTIDKRVSAIRLKAKPNSRSTEYTELYRYELKHFFPEGGTLPHLNSIQWVGQRVESTTPASILPIQFTYHLGERNSPPDSSERVALLQSAEDGKGNRVNINYQQLVSHEGSKTWLPVIDRLSIKDKDSKSEILQFQFSGMQTSQAREEFQGFREVFITAAAPVTEQPNTETIPSPTSELGWIRAQFSPEIDRQIYFNAALPNITTTFAQKYETIKYHGLHFRRLKSQSETQTTLSSHQTTLINKIEYIDYSDELCPETILESYPGKSVKVTIEYREAEMLPNHPSCFPSKIEWFSKHSNPPLNSSQGIRIQRNARGLPTTFFTAGNKPQTLKTIEYRPDFRVRSITLQNDKTTYYDFDTSYRLTRIIKSE